jgi:hypothetical protein
MSFWPDWCVSKAWCKHTPDLVERHYWSGIFDRMYKGEIDTWDYAWTASVWYNAGLTATPNVNLVTNIGIGPDATHTVKKDDQEGPPSYPLGDLTHPNQVENDIEADRYVFDHHFGGVNYRPDRNLLCFLRQIVCKLTRPYRSI